MKKIAVIGAGISGLTFANQLKDKYNITIFDKARSVGGRTSTRYFENYQFDYGAQFFTAKTDEFKEFCQDLEEKEVIKPWKANFAVIDNYKIDKKWQFDADYPHYVGIPKMNMVAKHLARNLEIILQTEISKIDFKENKWHLEDSNENGYNDFDYLIIAIPSHQAINLIPQDSILYQNVEAKKMQGCFCLMLGFKEELSLEFDAAFVTNSILSWISIDSTKPQRPDGFSLLTTSSNLWADENIENDLKENEKKLLDELKKIIDFKEENISYKQIRRWKYANAKKSYDEQFLFDKEHNLGVCGDYFIQGRIENAYLSGYNLAKFLDS